MSRIHQALHNEIQALGLLRDELKLQSHLLKAEALARWEALESEWQTLQRHLHRAQAAGSDAQTEVEAAVALLVTTLKDGYAQVRGALKS